MQWDRREQEIKNYQDRINQLEHENMLLRGYTNHAPYQHDPNNNSLICNDVSTQNCIIEMIVWSVKLISISGKSKGN